MQYKKRILLLMFSCLILFLGSCSFDEGTGGSSTIEGKIYVRDYNSEGDLVAEGYAPNWDVYILYGDDSVNGDQTATSFDGSFRFDFLHHGEYTVYAYSKCNACPNNIEPMLNHISIVENNQRIILEDIVVRD